jgi:hypothetical protein
MSYVAMFKYYANYRCNMKELMKGGTNYFHFH